MSMNRRSFLNRVVGGSVGGALSLVVGGLPAIAQSGRTDGDSGPNSDPGGSFNRDQQRSIWLRCR